MITLGNGCVRYEIGGADKDGKPETFVFDEQQIDVVETDEAEVPRRRTGGDRSNRPVAR